MLITNKGKISFSPLLHFLWAWSPLLLVFVKFLFAITFKFQFCANLREKFYYYYFLKKKFGINAKLVYEIM